MTDAPPPAPETAAPPPAMRPRRRLGRTLAQLAALLVALLALVGFGIDTAPGHRFIADRVADLRPASGLRIRIGRIDGSIWRHATLRDLRLYDTRGLFLEAPSVALDWRPGRWLAERLHVDRLASDLVILRRLPVLRPVPRTGPLLPRFAIHLGAVSLRLRLEPGVAGERRALLLRGAADTAHGRARIALAALSSAGDRLAVRLIAEPDHDLFDLAARGSAPATGVVPRLLGLRRPLAVDVRGDGRWTGWRGVADARYDGRSIARLRLTQARGLYALDGRIMPAGLLHGKADRLTRPAIRVSAEARYADRQIDGHLALASPALSARAEGGLDLARSSFRQMRVALRLTEPRALFPNMSGRDIRLGVTLDGAFRRAAFRYALESPFFAFDRTGFHDVRAVGAGRLGAGALTLPIRLSARQVTGVGAQGEDILGHLSVAGTLRVTARRLEGQGLDLRSDRLSGRLGLAVDLVTGRYAVDLSGGLHRYLIPNLGIVDVLTDLRVLPTPDGTRSTVEGRGRAWVRRFDNAFLRGLAGGLPTLQTRLTRLPDGTIRFADLLLTAPAIRIAGAGTRKPDGSVAITGTGHHASYGDFRLLLDGLIDHPRVRLALDRPVEALGLDTVQIALDPVPTGFTLAARGGSTLGPFDGQARIDTPAAAPTVLHIDRLDVTGTRASGVLTSAPGGLTGRLGVAGGGLTGTIDLSMAGALQRILLHLAMADARLAGTPDLAVRRGRTDADILLDPAATRVTASFAAQGLRHGQISLARTSGTVALRGGTGQLRASLAGARGRAFAFDAQADLAPARTVLRGRGQIDGRPVALDSPATVAREGDGWRLSPTTISYGGGAVTLGARFGGAGAQAFDATMRALPLTVLDMLRPGLRLGGAASGRLTYARADATAAPTAQADLRVRGLTRAGLVTSSRPVDLGVAAALSPTGAALRAVAASEGQVIGRAQARIAPLAPGGDLVQRLRAAPLFGQLRYKGPVDTLWRLTGVETIDLSGPVAIGADVTGSARAPLIRGSLETNAMRLEGATTGTVIDRIAARGRFDGSRLVVDRFTGGTREGGTVAGRASFDLASARGLGIDVQMTASKAVLLARDDIAATVTGPMTLRSDGRGGTVSGKIRLERANYRLGRAAAAQVPRLAVTEINRPADIEPAAAPEPWTLDLDTDAPSRLFVRGLGLDSEWRARLSIKGAVDNPAITGRADLIRGSYEFAGRRFDIDRGIIRFTGTAPVDPALDITAGATIQGLTASIRVTGTGLKPELSFTSVPALPEDELLSRLLFGTSIANLSAPEALQLAAAVNALRTGGGKGSLDPINAIRRVAGLDRLRIEAADVTTGQKTSIAAGKYIGRRTYVELVTDGQGYSATRAEFQVTRWLSLLSTVSTIGRQSVNVRISKDY